MSYIKITVKELKESIKSMIFFKKIGISLKYSNFGKNRKFNGKHSN